MLQALGFRAPLLVVGCSLIAFTFSPPPAHLVAGDPAAPVAYPLPVRVSAPEVSFELELMVLHLINQERMAAGLAPVMPHVTMRSIARAHGAELFAAGILSHRSLDGRTPLQRVFDHHVRVTIVGENLAYAPDIYTAHGALMASAPHRRNILSSEYALIGIGVLDGGMHGILIVQKFADAPSLGANSTVSRPSRRPAAFAPRSRAASRPALMPAH